ncbi:MAG: M48 family metallopeptidase [Betaproteobacteria bacterium]|nr:M48 family metallopeptidase [Betaproteobacteria bacterium]
MLTKTSSKHKKKPDSLPLQLDLFSSDAMQTLLMQPEVPEITSPPELEPESPSSLPTKRLIDFNGTKIEYEFHRSKRRTIGFLVNENGLRVTAPKRATLKSVEDAIREKERWITSKLRYFFHQYKKQPAMPLQLKDGILLPYLGQNFILRLRNGEADAVIMDSATTELIVISRHTNHQSVIEKNLRIWFQENAKQIFSERLSIYAAKLDIRYRSFSLSSAKRRWGSCSISGNIRLNWRLVHFPIALIDYVIAHELAHLIEMNHSKRFWNIVSMVYPNYRTARQQLNQQNSQILSLF